MQQVDLDCTATQMQQVDLHVHRHTATQTQQVDLDVHSHTAHLHLPMANTARKFVEDEGDTLSQDVSSREHRHSLKDETGIHKMSAAKRSRAEEDRKRHKSYRNI